MDIKYFRYEVNSSLGWGGLFKREGIFENGLYNLTEIIGKYHTSPERDREHEDDQSWMSGKFYFTPSFYLLNWSIQPELRWLLNKDCVRVLLVFEDSKDYTLLWEGKSGQQVTLENLEEQDYEKNKITLLDWMKSSANRRIE